MLRSYIAVLVSWNQATGFFVTMNRITGGRFTLTAIVQLVKLNRIKMLWTFEANEEGEGTAA